MMAFCGALLLSLVHVVLSQRPRYQVGYDCQEENQRGVQYKCEHCWFTEVPANIPNNTECVILSFNQIMNFKQDDFKNLTKLKKLWLNGNPSFNLSSLYTNRHLGNLQALHLTANTLLKTPSDLNLPELGFLDISGNNLRDVLTSSFQKLPKLKTLDISGNQFGDLTQNSFENLPQSLTGMMLNDAFLTSADGAFSRFTSLQQLSLDGNQFTGVPSDLPPSLKTLTIVDNPIIKTFRGSFSDLPNLQDVKLHANAIGQETFLGAPNLRSLELKTCRIESFAFLGAAYLPSIEMRAPCSGSMTLESSAFVGLNRLTKFTLTATSLSWIPPRAFADLPQLQEIWMNYNAIERVADDAFQGSPIKQIVLYTNRLRSVPPGLPPTLESLALLDNPITEVTTSSFDPLPHLVSLNIYAGTIGTDAFKNLPKLQQLSLKTCELRSYALRGLNLTSVRLDRACQLSSGMTLNSHSFSGIKNLTEIRITESGLKQIPSKAFADLPSLQTLLLNENFIRDVAPDILSGSDNVTFINLAANQLKAIPSALPASLTRLDFDCCNEIVQLLSFPSLPKLDYLRVSAKVIMSNAFVNTPSVTDLDLRSCRIESYGLSGLNKLQTLDMNEHCSFPGTEPMVLAEHAFSGMRNVETIGLSRNRIGRLPNHLFDGLMNLRQVDLSHNSISEVDLDAFINVNGMVSLSLQSNRLTRIPGTLPANLESLDFIYNDLQLIQSDSFPVMSRLQNLTLGSTLVREDSFRNCVNLRRMTLRTCDIEGHTFRGLQSLTDLKVYTCSGESSQLRLQEDAFVGLTSLTDLSIIVAGISIIPARAFANLNKLRSLSLPLNRITYFDATALEGCSSLNQLDLSNNQLSDIPKNLPASLTDLSLYNNPIITLKQESFNRMPNLTTLTIHVQTIERDAFHNVGNVTNLYVKTCNLTSYAMTSLKKVTSLGLTSFCRTGVTAANHSLSGMDALRNLTVFGMNQLAPKV